MDHLRGRCKRNAWPKRISVRRGPDLSVKKSGPAAVYIQDTQAGGGYTGGIYKRNTCTADAMKIDDCETTIVYFLSGSQRCQIAIPQGQKHFTPPGHWSV